MTGLKLTFNVGDSVYRIPHSYGNPWEIASIETVTKVHKNENVVVGGSQFRQDGSRAGECSYTASRIAPMNAENSTIYNEAKLEQQRRDMLTKKLHHLSKLSHSEQLQVLLRGGL